MEEIVISRIKAALHEDDISKIKEHLETIKRKFSYLPPSSMLDDKEEKHIEKIKRIKRMSDKISSELLNLQSLKEG